ncbi:hypothetical protein FISHEDRAFT_73046 [Fistulina hepatica ATCC 64428]|uniref:Uncharacterized protein n=1 Tax=Fistulina hepatica ATCC 64428 TaxID=1128425 RepID=A0A0D7AE94_9AGAR|nr:hypothetical protein FISHEDRAFT_73046 [Fistulina hepatica ATCC 64428]
MTLDDLENVPFHLARVNTVPGYRVPERCLALPPPSTFSFLPTSFTTNYSEAMVHEFLSGMRQWDTPVSVSYVDYFWMKGIHI